MSVPCSQEKDMEELQQLGGTHGLAKLLACDTAVGLLDPHAPGGASIESRHTSFGINKLPDAKPESFWMLLVGCVYWLFTEG